MKHQPTNYTSLFARTGFVIVFLSVTTISLSQKLNVDSLRTALRKEAIDTNKVRLMWQLANNIYGYDPDSALQLAQHALYLARQTNYIEGQSRSLGILATTFRKMGNYSQALKLNLQKLQLEEKRNVPYNLASVLMNIGIIYVFQDEYNNALQYYWKADSVISKNNINNFKYDIALNIGDAYDRLNVSDSSYLYFMKSLEIAKSNDDADLIGISLTGLGHSYMKLGDYPQSLSSYQSAIKLLGEAEDDETLCEASLGLAKLYVKLNQADSSRHYAELSLAVAKKDGFLSKAYDAVEFLTDHYKKIDNIDSAFAYAEYSRELNDSINSKAKIRELQILSSNEQFRQQELAEERKIALSRRRQQLQLLLIGIFIPGLFLFTLLLSRRKIHVRVIRALGVLSLLFLFEYLTLWLHPTVAELTGHKPIFEIMIFVVLASILIPLHHRTEHWLIERLIRHREFRGQTKKLHLPGKLEKKIHPPE